MTERDFYDSGLECKVEAEGFGIYLGNVVGLEVLGCKAVLDDEGRV